jgi:hypothetical protein
VLTLSFVPMLSLGHRYLDISFMMAQSAFRCSAAVLSTVASGSLLALGFAFPVFSASGAAPAGAVGFGVFACTCTASLALTCRWKRLVACIGRYCAIGLCGSHDGRAPTWAKLQRGHRSALLGINRGIIVAGYVDCRIVDSASAMHQHSIVKKAQSVDRLASLVRSNRLQKAPASINSVWRERRVGGTTGKMEPRWFNEPLRLSGTWMEPFLRFRFITCGDSSRP